MAVLVSALAVTARADFAASPGGSSQINFYDNTGTLTGFNTTTDQVDALAYDNSGNLLAVIGGPQTDGTVIGLPNGKTPAVGVPLLHGAALAASPLGGFAATGINSNLINFFDAAGNKTGFLTTSDYVEALAYDNSGNLLAIVGLPGSAGSIISPTGAPINISLGTLGTGASLAANPFGGFAASVGGSDLINFYDASGKMTGFLTAAAQVDALSYDSSGNLLAVIGSPGSSGTVIGLPGGKTADLGTLAAGASLASPMATVPEPSSLLLLGAGLTGLLAIRRHHQR